MSSSLVTNIVYHLGGPLSQPTLTAIPRNLSTFQLQTFMLALGK